jgi:hypothetical protein
MGGCFGLDSEGSDIGVGNRHLAHRGIGNAKNIVVMLHVRDVGRDGIVSRRHGDGFIEGRKTE